MARVIHYLGGQEIYDKESVDNMCVPIGAVVSWPKYKVETRQGISKDLIIATDIPDNWHALDGSVELTADDYPELKAMFSNNIVNGKIWLPYVAHKIIKVK